MRLWNGTEIGCRKCWQCRAQIVDDWCGRGMAESETASSVSVVSFTYGRDDDPRSDTYGSEDHLRAKLLTYSDLQKTFKSLRRYRRKEKKPGYKFKYIAVGEYGKSNARAHWHVIFFWEGEAPPHELRTEYYTHPCWMHGYSWWDDGSYDALRYALKYIQKDIGDMERQGLMFMSKNPPLGYNYFVKEARLYVDEGLAPQDLRYHIPGVYRGDGTTRYFTMRGVTAENFVQSYIDQWKEKYGRKPMPYSPLVNAWIEWGKLKEPDPTHVREYVPIYTPPVGTITEEEKQALLARRAISERKREKEGARMAKRSSFTKDLIRQTGSFKDKSLKWWFDLDCWLYTDGETLLVYKGVRENGEWKWLVVDDLTKPYKGL
jgi:hypothetical protein